MPIENTMMRGATRLRTIISTHLAAQVPPAIDIMRLQNSDLTEARLPYPQAYDSTDPTESDKYPYMGSFIIRDGSVDRIEVLPSGAVEVTSTYQVVMFVTARTVLLGLDQANIPSWEQPYRESSLRMRDDLMSVLKNVIFNTPSLGTARSANRALVDLDSWDADYPEPMKRGNDGNPVWICAGTVTLNVSLTESTVVPYIGKANVINTEVKKFS